MAAAGLLDRRIATTHWQRADEFRRLSPQVKLNPDILYADEGQFLTSAGLSASEPWRNGYVESFNSCIRDEMHRHQQLLVNSRVPRVVISDWNTTSIANTAGTVIFRRDPRA